MMKDKKNIVEQIIVLLQLQEKAISKAHFYSILRIEKMLGEKILKLPKEEITKQDLQRLQQSWEKTKSLIREIGTMCHHFFYEEKNENYNQVGIKIKKRRLYQNYSLKA